MCGKSVVLVTGATGYIGTNVVSTLLDMGHEVVATGLESCNVDSRAEFVEGDIFAVEDPFSYFHHPDICIHLAWRNGFEHNNPSHIDDLPLHLNFLDELLKGGLQHLVVMGSMHEVGYFEGAIQSDTPVHPESFYGIAKNALREALEVIRTKQPFVFQWLRGYYIIGQDEKNHSVFTKLKEAALRGDEAFPFTSGSNKYDFISVENLALEIALASTQDMVQGIVNCASGEPVSLREQADRFIVENGLDIQLDIGAYPDRAYDSPEIYGDVTEMRKIIGTFDSACFQGSIAERMSGLRTMLGR